MKTGNNLLKNEFDFIIIPSKLPENDPDRFLDLYFLKNNWQIVKYYFQFWKWYMVIPTAIVVDDDTDITQVFSELLESVNLKIVGIGHTGIDAIRLVKSQNPDIVFLDIHMPELNGVEALKEIKRISSKTHIVIITGDKSVDTKKLSHYGATGTIFKPFDMDQIMEVFEKIKTEEYTLVKK